MKKMHSVKKNAKSKKQARRFSKTTLMMFLGALAILTMAILPLLRQSSSNGVLAATHSLPQGANQKRYKATRPVVVDRQTGQLRMPTQQELDKMVADLSTLAKRPTENLQQTSVANGGVAIDLDGGYGGVVLARPNGDGTWETKCVFTFDEGAEFLGLEEEI
jgi:hypothetical protein